MESDLISRSAVIDRVAEFLGPKGLDEWEVMVAIREIIENAPAIDAVPSDRLGDFGKLFMEYKGCPRGAMGRMGGTPIEEEVLRMEPITDVDGGRWIPVNADALRELVEKYKYLRCVDQEKMPQKPLTLQELRELGRDDDAFVWEERRSPDNFVKTLAGALAIMCLDARRDPDMAFAYTYNVSVRAWRTLPTDEERAASPWEADNG